MDRRELLKGVTSALALALMPAVTGCATVGGPALEAAGAANPASLAEALRARTAAIREVAGSVGLDGFVVAHGGDATLVGNVLAAIWSTSTFRDLPPAARRSPEVQQWMLDEGPAIAEASFGLADLLDGLGADDRAAIADVVRRDPAIFDLIGELMGQDAERAGVEPERVAQVQQLFSHLGWRSRHQSVSAVMDEFVDRVDRICRRNGFERATWRERLAAERPAWEALTVLAAADLHDLERTLGTSDDGWLESTARGPGGHLGLVVDADSRHGATVLAVVPGSPAAAAGLREGDDVRSVDGVAVTPAALVALLSTRSPEVPVSLEVERRGERLDVSAALRPGPGDRIRARARATPREFKNATMRAGYKIFSIGGYILGGGAGLFVLGLGVMALEGSAEGFGAAMTVGGIVVGLFGLGIIILGGIVMSVGASLPASKPPPRPPPAPEPQPEPEPEPAP